MFARLETRIEAAGPAPLVDISRLPARLLIVPTRTSPQWTCQVSRLCSDLRRVSMGMPHDPVDRGRCEAARPWGGAHRRGDMREKATEEVAFASGLRSRVVS